MGVNHLEIETAEMFRKARPPSDAQPIAGLKQGTQAARPPSPHEPKMTPMAKGEELGNGTRLAEQLGTEEDAFVAPIHVVRASLYRLG